MRRLAAALLAATLAACGGSGSPGESIPPPTIYGFNPASGTVGTWVWVSGTGFGSAPSVSFGATSATSVYPMGDGALQVSVPDGATTGLVRVTGPGGTGTSATDFTVLPPFWTAQTSGTTTALLGIAADGTRLVAVGANGAIRTSDDGAATWTSRYSGTSQPLFGVATSGSRWVAVGGSGLCTHTLLISDDGSTWTLPKKTYYECNPPPVPPVGCGCSGTADQGLHAVTWTGSLFVAVGKHLTTGQVYTSPTGAECDWTARAGADLGYSSCSCSGCASIPTTLWATNASGARIVAAGNGATYGFSPPAGTPWSQGSFSASGVSPSSLTGIVWNGTYFVAVGYGGMILLSTDGLSWQQQTSGTTENLFGVAWSGALLVAVGHAGTTLSSSDGMTWTQEASGVFQDINAVAWDGSQFVAVGFGGMVLTAP